MVRSFATQISGFLLLAFPALFSIINPLGGAFVFLAAARDHGREARLRLARQVAIYSFVTLVASMLVGGLVLRIFGISVPVLRVAGGIVIALAAWELLHAGEDGDRGGVVAEAGGRDPDRMAFYPLTMPMTTGPGSISVAIALGTSGAGADNPLVFAAQVGVTSALICLLVYVLYRSSDRLSQAVGPTGTSIIARLSAFLLFCIGIQVLWTGVAELVTSLRLS